MQQNLPKFFLLCIVVLITGCSTSRIGLIELRTQPRDAQVYLNDALLGSTPLTFEFDSEAHAKLKIEKAGYYPEEENLSYPWILREIQKGNFLRGNYVVKGQLRKSWQIITTRRLEKLQEN